VPIFIHSEHKSYIHTKVSWTKSWLRSVVQAEGKIPGQINIVFISDKELRNMNIKFLKRDYLTDVISFDYNEGGKISGDIFISFDRVVNNADIFKVDINQELKRVMVHGLLHLLGYKDQSEKEKSRIREKENLYLLAYPPQKPK